MHGENTEHGVSTRRGFVFTISDRACVGPHSLITLSLQAYPLLDLLPHGPLGGGAVRARGDAPSDLACGVLHLEGDLDGVRVRVRVGVRVGVRVRVRVGVRVRVRAEPLFELLAASVQEL